MASTLDILFRIFLILYFLCQVSGSAYFAFFVNDQLRTYFSGNALEADAHAAHLIYAYLCTSAVLGGISLVATLGSWYKGTSEKQKKRLTCGGILSQIISASIGITMVVFAVITAKVAWSWWKRFQAGGQDVLARNCHGLAGMMATLLATVAGYLVLLVLVCTATGLAKCCRGSSKAQDGADKAELAVQETQLKDIEAQLRAMEFSPKDNRASVI
ncbi:hypothetical protein DL769_008361 [Monosporascus sp. CRB-8-3]|nr:hypothetical protein DL769_008361 [Monosporascus sp. CRB-8-3]